MKHIPATKSFLSSFFCTYFFFFKKVLNMSCTLNASLLWPLFWPWANLMLVIWRLIFWGEFCMTKATVEFRLDPILNHEKNWKYKCKNWGKARTDHLLSLSNYIVSIYQQNWKRSKSCKKCAIWNQNKKFPLKFITNW